MAGARSGSPLLVGGDEIIGALALEDANRPEAAEAVADCAGWAVGS